MARPLTLFTLLVVSLLFAATLASAESHYFYPEADAPVYQAYPNTNYGQDAYLRIRNMSNGNGIHSFLRFQVPDLDDEVVTSAKLTLRVSGNITEVGYYLVDMSWTHWTESWITWNNWDDNGTSITPLGTITNWPRLSFLDLDLTGAVTGPGPVTIGLASSADVAGQHFYSKDYVAYDPVLTVETTPASCLDYDNSGSPDDLLTELLCVLEGGSPDRPNWQAKLDADFSSWQSSSQNIPLIAAAVALYESPYYGGQDYRAWWNELFNRQASPPGSGSSAKIDHFKSTELFSNVYDAVTTTSVMAARYWALENPGAYQASNIANKSEDYLRRTFYAWGLTASLPDYRDIYDSRGATLYHVTMESLNCSILAMASPRSKPFFGQDSKRWLLGKATGLPTSCYKSPRIKPVVDVMEGQQPSVYGLTSGEKSAIYAMANSTTVPGNLGSILGGVRLYTDFHFLLWDDGRRATYWIGPQLNNNIDVSGQKGTVHTAFYDPSQRDLILLFSLTQNQQTCLDSANREIYENGNCGAGDDYITLPQDPPDHHYVLGPNGWRSCSNLACS